MKIKFINAKISPYGHMVEMALLEKNIPYEKEIVDLGNRPQWFVDDAPIGKVPLIYVDDKILFESIAICEFLEDSFVEKPLHVKDAYKKNSHRAWIQFANGLTASVLAIAFTHNQDDFDLKKSEVNHKLNALEKHLKNAAPFFDGKEFLLVDIALTCALNPLAFLEEKFNLGILANHKNVATYINNAKLRKSLTEVLPKDFAEIFQSFLERRKSYLLK